MKIRIFQPCPVGKKREMGFAVTTERGVRLEWVSSHLISCRRSWLIHYLSGKSETGEEPVWAFYFKIWLDWRLELLTPSPAASLLAFPMLNLIGCAALLALQLKHCLSDGGASRETHHSHRINHWEVNATAVHLPATTDQVSPSHSTDFIFSINDSGWKFAVIFNCCFSFQLTKIEVCYFEVSNSTATSVLSSISKLIG